MSILKTFDLQQEFSIQSILLGAFFIFTKTKTYEQALAVFITICSPTSSTSKPILLPR